MTSSTGALTVCQPIAAAARFSISSGHTASMYTINVTGVNGPAFRQ